MSTHLPGFQSFSCILHHIVLAKLATSSIRVKQDMLVAYPYPVIDIHGLRNLRVFYKPVFMNQDIVFRDIKSLH